MAVNNGRPVSGPLWPSRDLDCSFPTPAIQASRCLPVICRQRAVVLLRKLQMEQRKGLGNA